MKTLIVINVQFALSQMTLLSCRDSGNGDGTCMQMLEETRKNIAIAVHQLGAA